MRPGPCCVAAGGGVAALWAQWLSVLCCLPSQVNFLKWQPEMTTAEKGQEKLQCLNFFNISFMMLR